MALADHIASLDSAVAGIEAEVVAAVADIAALKAGQSGEVVTQANLDAIDALTARVAKAQADLKAGE